MSIRVVSESHAFGDDYTWVPDTEEFETLEENVRSLSQDNTKLSTSINSIERRLSSQDRKIEGDSAKILEMSQKVEAQKRDIEAELTNGKWKEIIHDVVKNATASYEQKVREVNHSLASQISELVKNESSAREITVKLNSFKDKSLKEFEEILLKRKNEILSASMTKLVSDEITKVLKDEKTLSLLLKPLCEAAEKVHWN